MEIETLKKYLTGSQLFAEIQSNGQFDFFTGVDLGELDNLLLLKYGERPLFSTISDFSVASTASAIVAQFGDTWPEYVELSEIPLAHSSSEIIETLSGEENEVADSDRIHRVSAFNDSNMVDEYGDGEDSERDRTHGYEKTTVRKNYNIDEVEQLFKFTKRSTLNRIIYDVGTFLTLSIY